MKTDHLDIQGMTCGHCVMTVRKELGKLSDVTIEDVQIGKAIVRYDEAKVSRKDIIRAIDEAGYKVLQP